MTSDSLSLHERPPSLPDVKSRDAAGRMLACSNDGFILLDADGCVLAATPAAAALLDATFQHGAPFLDALRSDLRADFASHLSDVSDLSAPDERRFDIAGRDGEVARLRCRVVPQGDDVVLVLRPLSTESTPARALAKLADAIPPLAWIADEEGWIHWYNRRWYDYTGSTLEEMEGWGWRKVHHPNDVDRVTARFRAAIESGEPWEDTFPLRRHDGAYRWFLSRALPLRGEDGSIEGWFGTNTDVTELREMELALREREERHRLLAGRLQTVLDVLPVGVLIADGSGNLQMSNEAARAIWGGEKPLAQMSQSVPHIGRYVTSSEPLLPGDWALARALDGEAVVEGEEIEIECADGTKKTILNYALPIRTDDEVDGAVAVNVDVTTLRDVETELRELNETLERRVHERTETLESRNRELQSFAYVASHDLQEPLRKIQTFADLMMTGHADRLDGEALDFLARMHDAASRMKQLLSDLLTYSRVTTTRRPFSRVNVRWVVDEVLRDLELAIERSGATIDVDADVDTDADRVQLRQLLNHLVLNAVKFRRDGAAPHVHIRADVDAGKMDMCRIVVEDNGIGFEEKYAQRIFQPFERLHGQHRFEGTGMGLAISRRIVDCHDGSIEAHGSPGEGSRFVIRIPLRQRKDAAG